MNEDPALMGGTVTTFNVGKGGVVDFKPSDLDANRPPELTYEGKFVNPNQPTIPPRQVTINGGNQLNTNGVGQTAQPIRQIDRRLAVVGYKGKAEAWINCMEGLYRARGTQIDREMFLAVDPREIHEYRDQLMEVGGRTFTKFTLIPYRFALAANRIGVPAPKNLSDLTGQVLETYLKGGPMLLCIPFKTLHGTPFDSIEQFYNLSKTPFLGYSFNKRVQVNPRVPPEMQSIPGAILVIPPGWVNHPRYPLNRGLSESGGTDIYFLRDEILRDMRSCEEIIGHGMRPGPRTVIEGYSTDEAFGPEINPLQPHLPPAGQRTIGAPLQPGQLIVPTVKDGYVPAPSNVTPVTIPQPTPIAIPQYDPAPVTVQLGKDGLLEKIGNLGFAALSKTDKQEYAQYSTEDDAFVDKAQRAISGHKVRQGKLAKKAATVA